MGRNAEHDDLRTEPLGAADGGRPPSARVPGVDPANTLPRHGAADPPRDPLADAARQLVVDDHTQRLTTPEPPDEAPASDRPARTAEPG